MQDWAQVPCVSEKEACAILGAWMAKGARVDVIMLMLASNTGEDWKNFLTLCLEFIFGYLAIAFRITEYIDAKLAKVFQKLD
jgi:hypothetical protein